MRLSWQQSTVPLQVCSPLSILHCPNIAISAALDLMVIRIAPFLVSPERAAQWGHTPLQFHTF